jgi:hypothetical protein
MTVPRLVAVALIFVIAAGAWMVLAASVQYRTDTTDGRLHDAVSGLWGEPQAQRAPTFTAPGSTSPSLQGSDIRAEIDLEQRRKGLLWYATYAVDFEAEYRVRNEDQDDARTRMVFPFPSSDGVYDGFSVSVDGREIPVTYEAGSAVAELDIPAGRTATLQTGYRTYGLDEWRYVPSPDGVGVIDDFTLTMVTDFEEVDFPGDAVSPTAKAAHDDGWTLTWSYDSLVSGRPIALAMPSPLNPGPVAARISVFAPVALLFYFASLLLLTATQDVRVHPMNYAFLAAGFFAFHLLFAYLVDRIDINVAFAISSVVSVALCFGYSRMVLGASRALLEASVGQFVFLVLFSYSFFFEGLTGLAVTIGSVLTLAFFMAKTGRVDWDEVFASRSRPAASSGRA